MPPRKKPASPPAVPEAAAVHDLKLHDAARAAGLSAYAVRDCPVCEVLVAEGFAKFPDAHSPLPVRPVMPEALPAPPAEAPKSDMFLGPEEVRILNEPIEGMALQAAMEAAESIKPGLAEKLAPVLEVFLRELASQKAQDEAEARWRASISKELMDLKIGISALHNNMVIIYRVMTGETPSPIKKVGP